jgi:hypothetical protein
MRLRVIRLCTVLPVLILSLLSVRQAFALDCTGNAECDDQNVCTTDTCDPTTHTCTNTPIPGPCEDGDACTQNDFCQGGICLSGPGIPGCVSCQQNADCNDGDACTTDVCDLGVCQHDTTCDDGDPCTIEDHCTNGTCVGTPLDCNDGAACTDDSCDGGTCFHDPNNDRCTASNECAQASCQPGPGADAQGCVTDTSSFENTTCSDDGNPCTTDVCHAGTCNHDPVSDQEGCSPVVPSYNRALDLRAGVERLLAFMDDEAQVGASTSGALDDDLAAVAVDLDGAAAVLAGRTPDPGDPQVAGIVRPVRGLPLALTTIAQQRGRVALLWARAAPAHVVSFLAAVSAGRRHGDLTPDAAAELRRNGRILLAGTKLLKRDVKNLQRTFSVFQR